MPRRIAIVGAGISGLLTAHGLKKAGYDVTLYSDKSPEDFLERSTPTGTAARFPRSLEYDAELGLNHWDNECPAGLGVSLALGMKPQNRLLTLTGRFGKPFRAIDVRLLSARWMKDLEARGGRVIVERLSVPRLDEVAAAHDLVIVAAGRKDLSDLFPRNAERSVHDKPQRNLCLVITRGASMGFSGVPFLPVRFNITAGMGEAFWVPFLHKSGEPSWNLIFEAIPGGPMDRFGDVKTGAQALLVAKQVIADFAPWDAAWAAPMTLADERAWLTGAVAPTVRDPVATLPSGRVVTAVGDTLASLDPIGGQGANSGTRMAKHLVNAIIARGQGALDAAWMTATFETFWHDEGRHIVRFNNLLLEPMSGAGKILLMSQYGSTGLGDSIQQRIADTFVANFDDTTAVTDALLDPRATKQVIARSGGAFPWTTARGALGVVRGQLRQAMKRSPRHPAHPF